MNPTAVQGPAIATPPGPTRIESHVSVRHGEAPPEGLVHDPFYWDGVLDAPPPRPLPPGEHQFAVVGNDLTDPHVRIEDVDLLRVHHVGDDLVLDVEHMIAVQERVLAAAIEAEERTVGEAVRNAEATGTRRIDRQERRLRRLRASQHPLAPVAAPLVPAVRFGRRGFTGTLRGVRAVTHGVVTLPDRFRDRWKDTTALLATPAGRARFRYGLVHPQELQPRQKAVTLFVSLLSLVVAVAVLHFLVTLIVPGFATPWRTALGLFGYAVVTSLGAPLPIEPLLLPAALAIGSIPTIAITTLAKVVAAYLVFYVGDTVNDHLTARTEGRPRMAAFLGASQRFARRFGTFAMALFIATPGLPDVIALYVFGSLGMPLRKYLLGVAIGGVLLYSIIVYGGLSLLGL